MATKLEKVANFDASYEAYDSSSVSHRALVRRINEDDKSLWQNLENSERDPETFVMYREMTLLGLDRDVPNDYVSKCVTLTSGEILRDQTKTSNL